MPQPCSYSLSLNHSPQSTASRYFVHHSFPLELPAPHQQLLLLPLMSLTSFNSSGMLALIPSLHMQPMLLHSSAACPHFYLLHESSALMLSQEFPPQCSPYMSIHFPEHLYGLLFHAPKRLSLKAHQAT